MTNGRDAWTDRLSEYVDGELDAADRAALEVHLQLCGECAGTVEALRAVAARATALGPIAPAADLWPAIAARISPQRRVLDLFGARPAGGPGGGARRWSFTLPQLAAAAVLLVVVSSATVWVALSRRTTPATPAGANPTPAVMLVQPAGFEAARYDAAIADLEQVLRQHRSELDPKTVRVIEDNLRIIDQATEQARRALAADPANPYLNGHLAAQLKLKVDLLRQATALVVTHS